MSEQPEKTDPILSVVMPVRNAGPYLDAAIESIVNQTYRHFNFIICDDGSSDGSNQVIAKWAARDSRIRSYRKEGALGPAGSSNWAVEMSNTSFVARMDGDDISMPDRLELQLAALKQSPEIGAIGSLWRGIDCNTNVIRDTDYASLHDGGFKKPYAHGSVMFRRTIYEAVGGYRAECDYWEDYDLFKRMAAIAPIFVLPKALYYYRFAHTSGRLVAGDMRVERALEKMLLCYSSWQKTGDYEVALAAKPQAKIPMRVYASLASIRIWSGVRPQIIRRALARGDRHFSLQNMFIFLYLLSGTFSPKGLRFLLRLHIQHKNRGIINADCEKAGAVRWLP